LFAGQVRVPLNTLTMGLTILKDDEYTRLTDAGRDVIDMMDGAAVRGPLSWPLSSPYLAPM
jgi:hypothetical protein